MDQNQTRTLRRKRRCPSGYIYRKGYTRKNTGTHVRGTCIRSVSPHKNNISAENAKRRALLAARLTRRGRSRGTRKICPPGKIPRSAYVRRISRNVARSGYTKRTREGRVIRVYPKQKSVYVTSACVEDTGKPGKLPADASRIGPLRKGELAKHGYSYKLPEQERRAALQKAVREFGPLSTYKKLNAVSKLTTLTSPKASSIFAADRNWIRKTFSEGGVLKAF